jgi:pyrimidine deaminase RibD-like protein
MTDEDQRLLRLALEQAKKCTPTSTAFCVGCVITDPQTHKVLATGYSRELPGNTHAEECALRKLAESRRQYEGLDMYTTMEPCSERLSGNKPCADRILEANGLIGRVVLGVREPDDFVKCVGANKLRENGIMVVHNTDAELERECLRIAKLGH